MFRGWDSFYVLIGSASGALIGLLFVVVTLTADVERSRAMRGATVYMTPTVFNFAMVLVLSALASAPGVSSAADGLILGGGAALGFAYATVITTLLRRGNGERQHWSDLWFYGVTPGALYLGLGAAAMATAVAPRSAAYGVALALLLILLLGIRNAWDLVTWLAPKRERRALKE